MNAGPGSAEPPGGQGRFRLEVFYNWPGLLGLVLIAINFAAALAVFAADLWIRIEYVGVVYALLALGALVGATIAGVGGLLGARRRRFGRPSRLRIASGRAPPNFRGRSAGVAAVPCPRSA